MKLNRVILGGAPQEFDFGIDNTRIIGTGAEETVNFIAGTNNVFFNAGTGDRVRLSLNLEDYTISASGNQLSFEDADGNVVTLNVGTSGGNPSTVEFADGEADLFMSFGMDGPQIHLGDAAISHGEALQDPESVNLTPVDIETYTLDELVDMEELPFFYKIDTEIIYEPEQPEMTVADAAAERSTLGGIIDQAHNKDDVDLDDLFTYSIKDDADTLLPEKDSDSVINADSLSITDEFVSVNMAMSLLDLNNFDETYNIKDDADTIFQNTGTDVIEKAGYISFTDSPVNVIYNFTIQEGRAVQQDGEFTILDFNPEEDSLLFNDLSGTLTEGDEEAFLNYDGVVVAEDAFTQETSIYFDPYDGGAGGITLMGIVDGNLDGIDWGLM